MTSNIEKKVLASVAAIYVGRALVSKTALECYALFLSSFCLTLLVSLPNVGRNVLLVGHHGLPAVGAYLLSALLNTSHVVQVLAAVGGLALLLVMVDALRALASPQARLV
jgi:hypothetical protein